MHGFRLRKLLLPIAHESVTNGDLMGLASAREAGLAHLVTGYDCGADHKLGSTFGNTHFQQPLL